MTKRSTLAIVVALFAGAPALPAAVVYSIAVDTSSIKGQPGSLFLQFDPGNIDADLATAAVTGFTTDGALANSSMLDGSVSPANAVLPMPVAFSNDQFPNDLFQAITFGRFINFTLTLGGNAVSAPSAANHSGTTFAFSLYDQTGTQPLLTSGADGAVAEVSVGPNGALSTMTFPTAGGGRPVATITPVPEPDSLAVMLLAAAGLWMVCRRRGLPL